jgi:hypothetical protein
LVRAGPSKQIGIIVWIIFGLGYIFGVINVISEALQFTR